MDRIFTDYTQYSRIGTLTHTTAKAHLLPLEEYIVHKSDSTGITCKFNVNPIYGGVPAPGDQTATVFVDKGGIAYHDVLGGILISTRNAENNCRNMDHTLFHHLGQPTPHVQTLVQNMQDKYVLQPEITIQTDKVLFLPGSNLINTVDHNKVEEILVDHSTAYIKPHPMQTEKSMESLEKRYAGRLIPKDESGWAYLQAADRVWSTYNSEMGMMAALLNKPWGNLTMWRNVFGMPYASVFRNFKYLDVAHNHAVMQAVIHSPSSGLVFPWQTDWQVRIDAYFDRIMSNRWTPGLPYPYDLPE